MWYRLWILRFLRFQAKIVWLPECKLKTSTDTHTHTHSGWHVFACSMEAEYEYVAALSTWWFSLRIQRIQLQRAFSILLFSLIFFFPARHSHELISGAENAILLFIHTTADKGWRVGSTIFYIASAAMCDLDGNQLIREYWIYCIFDSRVCGYLAIDIPFNILHVSQSVSSENRAER